MANFIKFILPRSRIILTRNVKSTLCNAIRLESSNRIQSNLHRVNNLEKKFLVWTGKFKSAAEVPDMVASETVEKARNKMRIRIANLMMLTTLVACLIVSISGKRAHERGESISQQNIEWHKRLQEDAKAENTPTTS